MAELTLEENIQQILPTLPLPIQKFFEQHKLKDISNLLSERYAFSDEQGTTLERELTFLLLGLENPDEFATALYEQLPISEQIVQSILVDIDQEIFVPLQEEMKKTIGNASQPTKPVMPSAPSRPTFAEGYGEVKEGFRLFGQPTPANPMLPHRPQPVNATTPKYFHLENKIPAPAVSPVPNEKLLEDHEEPSPSLSPTTARTAPPPLNLPGVISEVRPSPELLKVEPQIPTAQPKPVPPILTRPYSVDPYREQIEP